MNITTTLFIMFVVFCVALLVIGFITKKWINDSSDLLMAGKEVSLLVNIFGVAAIGFAGTLIVLVPGWTVGFGLMDGFFFGFAYGILGLLLYGVIFTPFIRRSGAQTLPEWLEVRFDSKTRTVITFATVLGLLGILANNIVSMAITVSGFTGWNPTVTSIIIYAIFLVFTFMGGFWAVTMTDFVQMIIGLIAIPLLIIAIINNFGPLGDALAAWPSGNVLLKGITGNSMAKLSIVYPSYFTIILLFGCFLVWGNNYYWLRAASCRSERVAKWSYVGGALLLVFFMCVLLGVVGIYAGSYMTDVFAGGTPPTAAYGVMLRQVPVFIASLALLGALAASISTATTAHMGATSTTVRDIYGRLINKNATEKQTMRATKAIMVILVIFVLLLTFYPGGPTYLFAFATAWLGPPAIMVILGAFWPRCTKEGAFWGGLIAIIVMTVLTILSLTGTYNLAATLGTHLGVVGFVITLPLMIIISFVTKANYYAESSWDLRGEASEEVKLNELQQKSLDLISLGFDTLGELTDYLSLDSSETSNIIEFLDMSRLIYRDSKKGKGFYSFGLSESGKKQTTGGLSLGLEIVKDNITSIDVKIIDAIKSGNKAINGVVKEEGITSLHFSVIVSRLIKMGYLSESGLMKRKLSVTTKQI